MKLHAKLLVGSAMLLTAACALADERSVKLSFAGTLVAPACTISIKDGGKVHFGDIERGSLSATGTTPLHSQASGVFVNCNAKSLIAVSAMDNRAVKLSGAVAFQFDHLAPGQATYPEAQYFSLGQTAAGKPVGAVAIRVRDIEVDSTRQNYVASGNRDQVAPDYVVAVQQPLYHGGAVAPALGPATGELAAGQNFSFPFDVAVTLNRQGELPASTDTLLDGSITLDVLYL